MKTDNIVAGVLFDFGGFLTTRPTPVTLSGHHDCSPMVDLIKEFALLRGVDINNPCIFDWQKLCGGEEE